MSSEFTDPEEFIRRLMEEDQEEVGLSVVTIGISKEATVEEMQKILGELGRQGLMLQTSITMDDGYVLVLIPMYGVAKEPDIEDDDAFGTLYDSGKLSKKMKH